jgi:ABC-type transport system involved in multi-copper enzyme maturation permease subunit
MTWQAIWGLARADFLERTRRYSFLVTLLFAVFLGFETATGKILIQLGEHRGVYTSGWIGTLMAMVISCFVSLIGFYIVKNSVERDRATGVGAILAATPLSKPAYAIGKWLSNFAVLAAIVGILAIAALLMQFIAAEDSDVNLWALLSPFLLLALPAMAVTAALALCFEMLPGLRGGAGSIIWFFLWTTLLSLPLS